MLHGELAETQLAEWMYLAKAQARQGRVNNRIPILATSCPDWFAVHIEDKSGRQYCLGNTDCSFPLMSVIKPFLLLFLLKQYGVAQVFEWVGMEPARTPFNSLTQLRADKGFPRNPMINSGAIVLADKLPGKDSHDRCQQLCTWLNEQAGCNLMLDVDVLNSVRLSGREANQALANYLEQTGHLQSAQTVLDTYEHICCLSGQVKDLVKLGRLLAFEQRAIAYHHRSVVNAVMRLCGLYEASAHYAVRVGLPMKSGISGALLAVVPEQGAIACYSPALDAIGNPIAGLAFVEAMCQGL